MAAPSTVEDYLGSADDRIRPRLVALRDLARTNAPAADEEIKWGHPAYVHGSGTILFVVSAHRKHVNFTLTPSTIEAFAADLDGWETGKGAVRIPYSTAIPQQLLARMIAHRIREVEVDGIGWK